jgi:tRNA threonylcarbamoyl adenosine modification protein (Sua5/YciO/YrdC/YwlC family)
MDSCAGAISLKKARAVLKRGGVIVIPSGNFFEFACIYNSREGINRILRIENRLRKDFILLLDKKERVKDFIKNFTETRKRVIFNLTPGNIVFIATPKKRVLPFVFNEKIMIKIPVYPFLLRLVKEVGPIISTEFELSRRKKIIRYKDLEKILKDKIEFIYPQDAEGFRYSTFLDIRKYPFKMIKKGEVSISRIENVLLKKIKLSRDIKTNILFVCTGNTCRSPMAMGILASMLPSDLKELVNIKSAGISTYSGMPVSDYTLKILKGNYGVNLGYYKSQKISYEVLDWADFVYVMEKVHLREIQRLGYYEKTSLLCDTDIPDPFGMDYGEYLKTAKKIENGVRRIVKELIYRYS